MHVEGVAVDDSLERMSEGSRCSSASGELVLTELHSDPPTPEERGGVSNMAARVSNMAAPQHHKPCNATPGASQAKSSQEY